MNKPLVSIIIPLYNGSNYIEQAIKAALGQTYKRVEIIVINDGSTDNGAGRDIVSKYGDKVIYLEKKNGGCASALNYGIKKAQGDFISWLSHDDLYYPEKIATQIGFYEKYGLDAEKTVISNYADLIDDKGNKIFHPTSKFCGLLKSKKAYKYLLFKKCFNGCGLLIPRKVFFESNFFNEDLRFVLDWNLWLKFAANGIDFYLDKNILVSNRHHNAQITVRQKQLHHEETAQTIRELFEILKNQKDIFYLKELFYFSYSTKRGDWRVIESYLKENHIKTNKIKSFFLRIKLQARKGIKKIYHKIR